MALSFEQQLAQVNGVITPSKLQPGQQPLRPQRSIPHNPDLDLHMCPICGHTATQAIFIKAHFLGCVETNGNPTGACWDDSVNVLQSHSLEHDNANSEDE